MTSALALASAAASGGEAFLATGAGGSVARFSKGLGGLVESGAGFSVSGPGLVDGVADGKCWAISRAGVANKDWSRVEETTAAWSSNGTHEAFLRIGSSAAPLVLGPRT